LSEHLFWINASFFDVYGFRLNFASTKQRDKIHTI